MPHRDKKKSKKNSTLAEHKTGVVVAPSFSCPPTVDLPEKVEPKNSPKVCGNGCLSARTRIVIIVCVRASVSGGGGGGEGLRLK